MENNIETYRERDGLTQQELATAVGVTRQTINGVECDRSDPSVELAFKLAAYFECSIETLFEPDMS